jgi:hypothetical protein
MAGVSKKPDVQENIAFERIEWRAASVLFWGLIALVAATLLGLFGNGPLSRSSAVSADGSLRVEYDRFGRFGAPMRMTVHIRPDADGTAAFTVTRDYLQAQRVEQITPPPTTTETAGDAVRYVFRPAGSEPLAVTIDAQSDRRWKLVAQIRAGSQSVRFWQFIYP